MTDSERPRALEASMDEEPPKTAGPDLAEEIAALEAEHSKLLSKKSFNLRRGLEGGIPPGTFFMVGSVAFLVVSFFQHGLDWVYVLGSVVLFSIGLLLYLLTCWSRWRREEKKRVSLLAVLDAQIERKRNELRRQGETSSG